MTFNSYIFSILFFLNCVAAAYVDITSITQIKKHIDSSRTTYVFLDLDHTVVRSVSNGNFFSQLGFIVWPPSEYKNSSIWDRLHFTKKLIPHEKKTLTFLKNLQAQNIPVVGLTARPPIIADRTLAQFKELNFTFSHDILAQKEFCLTHSIYKDGIIFCGTNDKGLALTEFLTHTALKPEKIVFADDLRKNVKAVEHAAERLNIECCACHIV